MGKHFKMALINFAAFTLEAKMSNNKSTSEKFVIQALIRKQISLMHYAWIVILFSR